MSAEAFDHRTAKTIAERIAARLLLFGLDRSLSSTRSINATASPGPGLAAQGAWKAVIFFSCSCNTLVFLARTYGIAKEDRTVVFGEVRIGLDRVGMVGIV